MTASPPPDPERVKRLRMRALENRQRGERALEGEDYPEFAARTWLAKLEDEVADQEEHEIEDG